MKRTKSTLNVNRLRHFRLDNLKKNTLMAGTYDSVSTVPANNPDVLFRVPAMSRPQWENRLRSGFRWMQRVFLLGVVLLLTLPMTAQDDILPLYALPQNTPAFTSSSIVALPNSRLGLANMMVDTVSIIEPATGNILNEIGVGKDPRSLAVTPDNTRMLVISRDEGTLSVIDIASAAVTATYTVGALPYAVVTNNNEMAYVSLQGTGEIVAVSLVNGAITARIPTPPFPAALGLWGDFLYVTHFWNGDFSLIYLPAAQVVRTIKTGVNTGLSAWIELDTRAGRAYLPQSSFNNTLPDAPFDALVLPVINVVDLGGMRLLRDERIDLKVVDRPVSMPFAAKLNPDRDRLYILNAGSDDISVIDLETRTGVGFVKVGANPRALLFGRDGQTVYIQNAVDSTLSVVSVRFTNLEDNYPVSNQTVPVEMLIGARLFHTSADTRMSSSNAMNCAVCHFDGQSDGRVWTGFNTPILADLGSAAPPFSWIGTWQDLTALDEHIRGVQAGTGLSSDGVDFDSLLNYVRGMAAPANPNAVDSPEVQRGAALFTELQCNTCHTGGRGTDGIAYDVGTGGRFVTPQLKALWLSAPYLHNGTAAALRDIFLTGQGIHRLPASMPDADIHALVAYLLSRN